MTATRVLLIDEGVLGHRTFAAQLRDGLAAYSGQEPTVATVPPANRAELALLRRPALLGRADLFDLRWRLRWSWQARRLFDRADADVALINTQAAALLSKGPMSEVPTVLYVDATVGQFLRLEYGARRNWLSPAEEKLIARLEQRAITAAGTVLTWTEWAAAGLRAEYDLKDVHVEKLHPGLDAAWWGEAARERGRRRMRDRFGSSSSATTSSGRAWAC